MKFLNHYVNKNGKDIYLLKYVTFNDTVVSIPIEKEVYDFLITIGYEVK